jgi:hypothetical protein
VGVLAVGLRGGVRPPAGCSRDAGRGAQEAERGGVAAGRGAAAGGPRPRCGAGCARGRTCTIWEVWTPTLRT